MARTLDMRKTVAPDEPMFVLDLDGAEHKVVRLPVWDVLALKALDEDSAEDLEKIRQLLLKAVPTYPPAHFEVMTTVGYVQLVQFILTGERASAQEALGQATRPTTPPPVSTEPSESAPEPTE